MQVKDIEIDYLSFQYMSEDKSLQGLRKGSVSNLDSKAHLAYSKYLSTIATESESDRCYDIFKPVSGGYGEAKKELDAALRMSPPSDKKKIDDCTLKLATLLKQNERASVPGVFFLALFRHDGNRYVSILKLDIFSESWASYEARTSKMTLNEIVGELPGSEAKFRKGSIFPHPKTPNDSYMRIYQKDHPARYFDTFLGGERRLRARVMMNDLRGITRKLTGEWPNYDETQGIHEGLKSHVGKTASMIDKDSMADIIANAIPSHAGKSKEVVEKYAKKWGVISLEDVLNLQMEILFGNVKLKGPIGDLGTKFKHKVGGKIDRHRIEGTVTGLKMVKE